ncbi:MAG: hypothetical protein LIP09_10470 [Bacteroidales bacterium]|nr:hypothetical protein [Bacteroidales bacterium]
MVVLLSYSILHTYKKHPDAFRPWGADLCAMAHGGLWRSRKSRRGLEHDFSQYPQSH